MAQQSKYFYADMALALVEAEATPGVNPTPTPGSNAIFVQDCTIEPVIEMVDMTRYGPSFRSPGAIPGKRYTNISFKVTASGVWAMPGYETLPRPEIDPLMLASGFEATATTSGSVYVAARKSAQGPFDISGGTSTIVVAFDGGGDVTLTPDYSDTVKYPDNERATAAQIVADVGSPAGGVMIARKGRLYIKSSTTTVSASINVKAATDNVFGFTETLLAGSVINTAHTYNPSSFACTPTCTVYVYMFPQCAKTDDEAMLFAAHGCVFNATFDFDANGECLVSFEGKGSYVVPADTTFPTGAVFRDRSAGMVGIGASFNLESNDGEGPRSDPYSKISFNPNFTVQERTDQSSNLNSYGVAGFFLTRTGSMTGSFDPELVPVTDYDRWALVGNANRNSLEILYSAPNSATMTVVVNNLQLGAPKLSKTNGRLTYDQPFYCRDDSDAGDDYFQIIYAAVDPGA